MLNGLKYILTSSILVISFFSHAQQKLYTDVLVVGGGTGGTAAGIQSARSGAKTIIAERTPWLGGMLSAAGVTASDGNDKLYSGIWQEFRLALYKHYNTRNLATGWVSNTLFEPHVADSIFKVMASKEKLLQVYYGYRFISVVKKGNTVTGAVFKNNTNKTITIYATVTIDGTELGDVIAKAGAAYNVGMEANELTQENAGVTQTNNTIQDLTYAAILKDYGANADKTIARPAGYDPMEFDGCCTNYYHDTTIEKPTVDAAKMLVYGKLPNGKYMINWPKRGNDTYLNVVEMSDEQREKEYEKAKQTTYRFIYFIQHELGFKNLGIADDEFTTKDKLAYIPYHREGRRTEGLVRFTMRNISEPFTFGDPLYRTGISVGDYPIDHHHKKNKNAPQHLYFYPIPSFNVPIGSLIPTTTNGLLSADKNISVSNVVNGTTRLQPCVLLTGQAVGVLAALSVQQKKQPAAVSIREVQQALLNAKAYIMPYIDVTPASSYFEAVQHIGATGILKGKGVPHLWANQTWFYPDSICTTQSLLQGLSEYVAGWQVIAGVSNNEVVNVPVLATLIKEVADDARSKGKQISLVQSKEGIIAYINQNQGAWPLKNLNNERALTRAEVAVILDNTLHPFFLREVNYKGEFFR
ncbi:FAD-dependent oxidoreductase [Chitinophagaceae bacterium LWZ2-11]